MHKFGADYLGKCIFTFKMDAIVCISLDTPIVLYLYIHWNVSDGWKI